MREALCSCRTAPISTLAQPEAEAEQPGSPPPLAHTPLQHCALRAMKSVLWAVLVSSLLLWCAQRQHVTWGLDEPLPSRTSPGKGQLVEEAEFEVKANVVLATIDDDFLCATLDWWPPQKCDYGTCSWGNASLLNLDLTNPLLEHALTALAPFKLRLGGSLQDQIVYDVGLSNASVCQPLVHNTSAVFGFTGGCFPTSRWDSLNKLFNKTGSPIAFGLNALFGRIPQGDGKYSGQWDSSNAEAFIRYTVERGYDVQAWEFGNELGGQGVGTTISAAQFAEDVIKLKSTIAAAYVGRKPPILVAPDSFFDKAWYTQLLEETGYGVVDVASRHVYNLGPGSDTKHILVDKILDPDFLGAEANNYQALQAVLQDTAPWCNAWVGEAGGAYNSGKHFVTDAFVSGFWYVDQLGMAASFNNKAFCRQSLIGGNYGLLNTTTFDPNPDFYSALLWSRLVGKKVLQSTISLKSQAQKSFLRGYAHCHKEDTESITVILLNFSNDTTHIVSIFPGEGRARALDDGAPVPFGTSSYRTRQEYHLSAPSLDSQKVRLNGKSLKITDDQLPELTPVEVSIHNPVHVQPLSIVFVVVPYAHLPACSS